MRWWWGLLYHRPTRLVVHIILITSQPVFALSPECCVLSEKTTNTNFIVFDFTWSGLQPTIYRTRGMQTNHYTTERQDEEKQYKHIQWQIYIYGCWFKLYSLVNLICLRPRRKHVHVSDCPILNPRPQHFYWGKKEPSQNPDIFNNENMFFFPIIEYLIDCV